MKQFWLMIVILAGTSLSVRTYGRSANIPAATASVIDTVPDDKMIDSIYSRVEVEASFDGGPDAWRKFLEKNLNAATPLKNHAPAGTYTVIILFVVDKTGKVGEIKALTQHGYGMEQEVIRLLKRAPNWIPARQEGRAVKAYRKQPVTFVVLDEKKKKKKSDD